MKNSIVKASFGILATSLIATSAFAGDLKMNIIEYGSTAQVRVTAHGQAIKNVPVTVSNGAVQYTAHTNDNGSFVVSNTDDVNKTYTFVALDNDGSQVQATRLLGK